MAIFPARGLAAILVAAPLLAQSIPVQEHTLSNGMRVLLVERHDQPTIACGWMTRAGSANEHPGMTGIAHLFEHMMFKGTTTIGTRDAKRDAELNEAQDRVQAEIRKEMDLLREKQRRGEIRDMMDPAVRTPKLQQLAAQFDALVKEQRALIVKDELDKIYKQEGAQGLNANTSNDRTFYHIEVPSNKLELWAWMESDRLKNAVFREFYSERDVVLEERRQRTDATPTGKAMEAFNAMVWQAHPYSWPVIGWPSDISQVTREQANAFFATYYAPNNITAVLVGDFKSAQVLPLMERYFGRIPANPKGTPEVITTEPPQPAEQRMSVDVESMPMAFAVCKTVSDVHKDAAALEVLGAILNGASGRLNKELVLKQKVATGAQAFSRGMKYGGMFYLIGMPTPEQTPEALEPRLFAEVEKIAKEGVSPAELEKVKNQVQAEAYAILEHNGRLRNALAEAECNGSYKDLLEMPARMKAVTVEDVKRVAGAYFAKENRNVLLVHRKQENGPVDPELAKLPAEARPMVQAQLKQLLAMPKDKLQMVAAKLEEQASKVPAEAKPVIDYMLAKVRTKLAQPEAK